MSKAANITYDRYAEGTCGYRVILWGDQGADVAHQCRTLEEAKRLCTDHLLPEGGVVYCFSRGELEPAYKVEAAPRSAVSDIYWAASEEEELWHHTDPSDAVAELVDGLSWEDGVSVGDILTVYSAESSYRQASAYLPNIQEVLSENAADEHGDLAEDWPDGECQGLQQAVARAVDEWATTNNRHPRFGQMGKAEAHPVRITAYDETTDILDWEFLPKDSEGETARCYKSGSS